MIRVLPLVLAGILTITGVAKRRGAFPGGRFRTAYRAVGVVEVMTAAALLVAPSWAGGKIAACLLGLGFITYLAYARIAVPAGGCGCLGTRSVPITWRSFARAGLVLVAGAASIIDDRPWRTVDARVSIVVMAVAAVIFVGLSPELDIHWVIPLRRLRLRYGKHPLAGTVRTSIPLAATLYRLERSEAYRITAPLLRSGILDHWDTDGWRILTYGGRDEGRPVTAVFAVPLSHEDNTVRVTVLDDMTDQPVTVQRQPSL